MKLKLPITALILAAACLSPAFAQDQNDVPPNPKPKPNTPTKEWQGEKKADAPRPEEKKALKPRPETPMEKHAFLGVATTPMDPTLRTHLGLDPGVGLVVQDVVPDSPAAEVLKQHDVLVFLRDQQLINHDQLAVLVRNSGIGAKVPFTVLRGGETLKTEVTLGEREGPPLPEGRPFGPGFGFEFDFRGHGPGPDNRDFHRYFQEKMEERFEQHRDQKGSGPQRYDDRKKRPDSPPAEKKPEDEGNPKSIGVMSLSTAASSVTAPDSPEVETTVTEEVHNASWVEGDLVLNYTEDSRGKRLLVLKKGEELFHGAVDTEEQRQSVPEEAQQAFDNLRDQLATKTASQRS